MAEVCRTQAVKGIAGRRTLRRTTVIAMIVAAELGSAGFAIGETAVTGPGLTTATTVSINGATGTWAPTQGPGKVGDQLL